MSHPPVNFADAIHLFYLNRSRGITLSAYLVALAAYQRGLKVVFHYDLANKCKRFKNLAVQGYRAELMSISDGSRKKYFYRCFSEDISHEDSMRCEDKHATKLRWVESRVPVADSIVISKDTLTNAEEFLAQHPHDSYILKPLSGSLGKGVLRGLSKDDVLKEIPNLPDELFLLEEEVHGREYRVYVLDGKVVYVWRRFPAMVTGNGLNTIEELVNKENNLRLQHPYREQFPFSLTPEMIDYLSKQGLSKDSIPQKSIRVQVFNVRSQDYGGSNYSCTEELPDTVKKACIKAQQSLNVSLLGLDVIVAKQGTKEERIIFLEANQNPHISGTALSPDFKSEGNTVAEHLIDFHFPNSIDNRRHVDAAFDMETIKNTLNSGVVDEIALPVLNESAITKRLIFNDKNFANAVIQCARVMGIHAVIHSVNDGRHLVCITTDGDRYQALKERLDFKSD